LRKRIKVDCITRVEGEGGIRIDVKDGTIQRLDLKIFEAPRFFEPILRGRSSQDAIDFTARICGICPVAYQMSAVHAIEKVFGVEVEDSVKHLRRLMYCGEWIESHALHIYYLHGPDFYDLESAWAEKGYLPYLQRGMRLKKLGNKILTVIGGRPVHPVSVRVGGFFRTPGSIRLKELLPHLESGYEESIEGVRWAVSLFEEGEDVSDPEKEYIALRDAREYPMNYGNVISSGGLDLSMSDFLDSIEEYQVEYSTALHSGLKGGSVPRPYLAGPISRLNLNHDLLPDEIKTVIRESGITLPLTDLRKSIIARSVELAYALFEAIRIIRRYEEPSRPFTESEPRGGEATWITEAPRGILIHRYEIDNRGKIADSRIIPPTSQNLAHIERSLHDFIMLNMNKPVDYLKKGCERIVRSYDPCISCSVHLTIQSV